MLLFDFFPLSATSIYQKTRDDHYDHTDRYAHRRSHLRISGLGGIGVIELAAESAVTVTSVVVTE